MFAVLWAPTRNTWILDREGILTAYFTRVGNSDFEEDVDAVSSASLMEEDGELIGNSQLIAAMVQNSVGGELCSIQTEKKYPSAYSDTVSVAKDEIDSDEKVALVGSLPDFSQYDMVVLVYPKMEYGISYSAYSEKRWVYGTVYKNDRKKCVYSKRKVWISDSEERGLIISFFVSFLLGGNGGITLNGMVYCLC